ncbi:MAG TPA: hypothetical protein PLO78_08365 [Candidatus Omnitrophota bacterium]|nr:hypothetical protein [Candidatus Omnitrophota bacterium]
MDATKKLIRGLKDVSSIFQEELPETSFVRQTPELQVLGVSSPQCDNDALFLNTYFASKIASPNKPCSLISLLSRSSRADGLDKKGFEPLGDYLKRHCIYWDELQSNLDTFQNSGINKPVKSRDIFLDFEYQQLLYSEQIVRLLDKWIILLRPTGESLAEGYKLMKAGVAINPQVEFFVALEGDAENLHGSVVYEYFSDFVFQHLNFNLTWLGWLDLSCTDRNISSTLHTDLLLYQAWNARPCLEKFALAEWIESVENESQKKSLEGVSS